MMTLFFLEESAKTHHCDLLREAERWREVSQAMGNKSHKPSITRRIMEDIVKHGIHVLAESRFKMSTIQQ